VDTRIKILDAAAAAARAADWREAGLPTTVVSGHFDPLLASHAVSLEQARPPGGRLLVIVTSPEQPILDPRARAELVAGLAAVDAVTVAEGDALSPAPSTRLEAEHEAAAEGFIARVLERMR
jgi:bifunctional ADP-heptose synthase (sugar kinase/adenylyltransferase)